MLFCFYCSRVPPNQCVLRLLVIELRSKRYTILIILHVWKKKTKTIVFWFLSEYGKKAKTNQPWTFKAIPRAFTSDGKYFQNINSRYIEVRLLTSMVWWIKDTNIDTWISKEIFFFHFSLYFYIYGYKPLKCI